MSEWIDVKERLPNVWDDVIVWSGVMHLAHYRPASHAYYWDCDTYGLRKEEVIYWMKPGPPANLQETAEPVKHDG